MKLEKIIEIIEMFASDEVRFIYGWRYGAPSYKTQNGWHKSEIREMKKEEVDISRKDDGFFYVYGYPGPDYDFYKFTDYGKTWAFTEDELLEKNQ